MVFLANKKPATIRPSSTSQNMKLFALNGGGTLGMTGTPLSPAKSAAELLTGINVPAGIELTLEDFPLRQDSTNVMHKDRVEMANAIARTYDAHDAFVIFHGTDSLAETCAFLAMTFKLSLQKPLFVIGSQMSKDESGSDVPMQIANTFRVAGAFVRTNVVGVYSVCLGDVLDGARIRKRRDSDFSAFYTPGIHPVAQSWPHVLIQDKARRKDGVLAVQGLRLDTKFEQRVLTLNVSADNPPDIIMDILDLEKVRGLILECKGAGNLPDRNWELTGGRTCSWIDVVRTATAKGIHVGILSPFEDGRVNLRRYALGQKAKEAGAISLESLTPAMGDAKFRHAIAKHPDRPDLIQQFISTNILGELLPGFEDES